MEKVILIQLSVKEFQAIIKEEIKSYFEENPIFEIKSQETEDLMTINGAANFLDLSKATIYSKVSRRELPVMKRGKRLYFSKEELTKYLKEGRFKTIAELQQEATNYIGRNL